MDSFLKCVFVRAGKHTSVHDVHPHSCTSRSRKRVFEDLMQRKKKIFFFLYRQYINKKFQMEDVPLEIFQKFPLNPIK